MSYEIVASAQLAVYLNSSLYGVVKSIRYTSDVGHKEQFALDSLVPYELTPTVARVSGSVSIYRATGIGSLEDQGITAHFEDVLRQQYFTMTIRDTLTDDIVFETVQTVVSNQSWEMSAKGLMEGTFGFTGISWTGI